MHDEATLISGSSLWNDSGKLNYWHDLPSIQPYCTNINTALTTYYSLKTNVGFAAGVSSSVSAKAKGGFEPTLPIYCLAANVRSRETIKISNELRPTAVFQLRNARRGAAWPKRSMERDICLSWASLNNSSPTLQRTAVIHASFFHFTGVT